MGILAKIRRMYFREKVPLREIARRTGLSRNTVRSWLRQTDAVEPKYPKRVSPSVVGDRLDNDVEPARRAGMVPVFLRRGPWAIIQSGSGRFASPVHAIDSLSALPALLSGSLGT